MTVIYGGSVSAIRIDYRGGVTVIDGSSVSAIRIDYRGGMAVIYSDGVCAVWIDDYCMLCIGRKTYEKQKTYKYTFHNCMCDVFVGSHSATNAAS